ncbi:MAG: HpcH/HpaI aldolase/citrate lyase family protein, partial [Burkholderiaceae bacterium]
AHRDDLRLFVRVNGTDTGLILDDLAAVVRARPFGVILPKCGGGPELARLDAQLAALEVRDGIAVGTVRVLPIVTETAAAVLGTGGYASAGARLVGMTWGGEDLAADIGALANRDAQGRYTEPYRLARSLTLLAATAAQVIAVDAVYIDFRDVDGLRTEAADALRDGFTAKLAIHPDQVGPINEAFTPSADAIERARRVIAAFEAAPGAGAVALDGRMLDRPHRRSAERVLARAAGTGAPR